MTLVVYGHARGDSIIMTDFLRALTVSVIVTSAIFIYASYAERSSSTSCGFECEVEQIVQKMVTDQRKMDFDKSIHAEPSIIEADAIAVNLDKKRLKVVEENFEAEEEEESLAFMRF
jgi:hypothetical protein